MEPSAKSFREEQCEVRNGPQTDPKGVKTFVEWVPKYAGVLPKDVCKLTCRAKGTGYYVVFSQRVSSGAALQCRFLMWKRRSWLRFHPGLVGDGWDRVPSPQQLGVCEGEVCAHRLWRHHRLQTPVWQVWCLWGRQHRMCACCGQLHQEEVWKQLESTWEKERGLLTRMANSSAHLYFVSYQQQGLHGRGEDTSGLHPPQGSPA